jgi:colanic acid/amylovoran biosynthesis glycosyltransferase
VPTAPSTLGIIPNLTAIQRQNGRVVLERRFLSGVAEYQKHWAGPIRAILEPVPESELETNLDRTLAGDNVEVDPKTLPFELAIHDFHGPEARRAIKGCGVALGGLQYRQVHLSQWAKQDGVPFVYGSEYTLETRIQIIRANGGSPLRMARRIAWEVNQERLNRRAVGIADGIQCNGTPTFDAYRGISLSPLLYFDSRISKEQLITQEALERRLFGLKSGRPLRLCFAGRINKMKGADQLVDVGRILTEMDLPFELHLYGGGVLADEVRNQIAALGIGQKVRLMGHVPFAELLPKLQADYDLYLCCHPQGDPAMAYLEMMSNGLPIVGYANEALAGILKRTSVGKAVPLYDNEGLARVIRELNDERGPLLEWSRTALGFAKEHTFDQTFRRRIEHLAALAT